MQLLVRTVDKELSGDPIVDRMRSKAGYVIAAKPDGEEWGVMELTNPEWVILSVPGMTQEMSDSLTSTEVSPQLDTDYVPRKRQVILDLPAIQALEGACVRTPKTGLLSKYEEAKNNPNSGKIKTDLKKIVSQSSFDKQYSLQSTLACFVVLEADNV